MEFTLTLAVEDLEKTFLFYDEVLGLPVERLLPAPGHPPILLLQYGGSFVVFRRKEDMEAFHPALFQALDRHPRGIGMSLEFTIESLRPVLRNIARVQLHTLYEMEDDEFGRREIWLHDPDGYLIILNEEERPEER